MASWTGGGIYRSPVRGRPFMGLVVPWWWWSSSVSVSGESALGGRRLPKRSACDWGGGRQMEARLSNDWPRPQPAHHHHHKEIFLTCTKLLPSFTAGQLQTYTVDFGERYFQKKKNIIHDDNIFAWNEFSFECKYYAFSVHAIGRILWQSFVELGTA